MASREFDHKIHWVMRFNMIHRNQRFRTNNVAAVLIIAAIASFSSISMASAFTLQSRSVKIADVKLFNANEENIEKMSIGLLTDENRDTLLRPAVDPSRPILVDAFA